MAAVVISVDLPVCLSSHVPFPSLYAPHSSLVSFLFIFSHYFPPTHSLKDNDLSDLSVTSLERRFDLKTQAKDGYKLGRRWRESFSGAVTRSPL